jgi:hypothetical protein
MDEQRRMTVAKMAQAETRARQRFEALGYANTAHLDAQGREDLDTEYAIARANWYEALDALRAVVEPGPSAIELVRKTGRVYVPM